MRQSGVAQDVIEPARAADPGPAASDTPAASPTPASAAPRQRFYALDALRGLAIGLMVFVNLAGNHALPPTFEHSEWHGLTLADTVFPGFMVAMGTALPYATRAGWRRVVGRAILLVLIGSALVSYESSEPFDLTVGVLQMIGVAYLLTWFVTRLPRVAQSPVVALLLIGVTAAYLWYPVPPLGGGSFEPAMNVGDWFDAQIGFAPAPENPHAWLPGVGSVFIGVLAGRISREHTGWRRVARLGALGGATLLAGLLLGTVVPINKYLWTSSFVLVTGGIAVLALLVLALVTPPRSKGGPVRPLVVLGGHAIVVYAFSETVVARARAEWLWPTWEPVVTERWGEVAAGAAFPLGAVLACLLLAWAMELLDIHVRL